MDYLEGSGWTTALTVAEIASTGTVDSFLKASHLTKTRHAHQVTALALAQLQIEAFLQVKDLTVMKQRMHGYKKCH